MSRKSKLNRKKNNTFYQIVNEDSTDNDAIDFDDTDDGVTNYGEYEKIYMFGEKIRGFKSVGPPQNFTKLQQQHIQNKTLFIDENFTPKSIVLTDLDGDVVWKRPFELISDPQFIINGATRFDVDQGLLGDCWFLAAIANLTMNEKLFSMVVPSSQNFTENYTGIFHFRFWQFGRWVDVVIDDRLPTINNELVYLRSSNPREFWPSLLEKAYAKFYGSYKNIEGGQISEALEDLCGGFSEFFRADQPGLYEIMLTSFKRSSFMGCSIVSQEVEGRRPDGLITTHAYSITNIQKITAGDYEKKLLRIRNPWGNSAEWNGQWSDLSKSWNLVAKETRNELLTKKPDGEFWMEIDDFQKCFTFVDICHPNPSACFFSAGDNKNWNVSMFEGSWVPNATAGGGLENIETFAHNPQYHLTIKGSGDKSSKFAVLIGLMQKDRRIYGESDLPLEINIFKVKSNSGTLLDKNFFETSKPVLNRSESGVRQLTVRAMLPRGRYCVIPSSTEPNVFGTYLLRIYSEVNAHAVENDEQIGYSTDAVLSQRAYPPSQVSDDALFRKIAGTKSEIGWDKVQRALNKLHADKKLFCFMKSKIQFSKDTCKNIVSLWDSNYSGSLDSQEFGHLMQDVASLKVIFKKFDRDNSGKLNGFELRNLLTECGYKVDRQILITILLRYGYNGQMSFENFVVCAFKLRTMIDEFHRRKTLNASTEQINVNKKDWLQTTLYS